MPLTPPFVPTGTSLNLSGNLTLGGNLNATLAVITSTGTNNHVYLRPNGTGSVLIDTGTSLIVHTAGTICTIDGGGVTGTAYLVLSGGGNTNCPIYLRAGSAASVIVDSGNKLDVQLSVASTSTTTGSITTAGGIGLAGALNAGGTITALGAKQNVTGSRGGNAALASLLTKLVSIGLITDSTS